MVLPAVVDAAPEPPIEAAAPPPAATPTPPPATADSTTAARVPTRPSTKRPSKYQRMNSVHAKAVLRRPVFTHKKYLRSGKCDLPKHLLAKAMAVHANNLL